MNEQKPVESKGGHHEHRLLARRIGIDTSQEAVIYMRDDCPVCRSEGFTAHARVLVRHGTKSAIATLNVVRSRLMAPGEAGLSDSAWQRLSLEKGGIVSIHHIEPLKSLSFVRAKIYGNRLGEGAFREIVNDVTAGHYSDIHLSSFVTACAGDHLNRGEMLSLTKAMIDAGERIDWGGRQIVDKHCVGGLPGNRTTPIIVSIVTAAGLTMPKTSSRAITSPAGTADTMETLAPVELDVAAMKKVVEQVGGCIIWGGSVCLSPADDVLIRIERALDIDSEGQLIASVLSKKLAAGATHVVLDIPVGATAKVRSKTAADALEAHIIAVASKLGLAVQVIRTDGSQPVGRGIGPALEARDVLAVLRGAKSAPADLRDRATRLAGAILEMGEAAPAGTGLAAAAEILATGRAWKQFQAICEAQGGMRKPPTAAFHHPVIADRSGQVTKIDNRLLAQVAKLAGAPASPAAGIYLEKHCGDPVAENEPLFTIHAESPGELEYAREYVSGQPGIITIGERS